MTWPRTEAQQAHVDQIEAALETNDEDAKEAALLSLWAEHASVEQLTDFVRRIRKNGERNALKAVDARGHHELVDELCVSLGLGDRRR